MTILLILIRISARPFKDLYDDSEGLAGNIQEDFAF